jgi:hypothetical protein
MTRGLLLGGVVQALLAMGQKCGADNGWEKLDPMMQRFIVSTWLKEQASRRRWYPEEILWEFKEVSWIQSQSRGYDASYEALSGAFGR